MTKKKIPKTLESAINSREPGEVTRETEAHSAENRPDRRPLSQMYRLNIPHGIKEEGYTYRYILDRADRIEMFNGAWWEQVIDPFTKRPIKKASGGGEYLLLYRIKSEFYKQDQIEKAKKPINLLVESAKLKRMKDVHEYIPAGHEAVLTIKS